MEPVLSRQLLLEIAKGLVVVVILLTCCPQMSMADSGSWQKDLTEGEANVCHGNLHTARLHFNRALTAVKVAPHSIADQAQCRNKLANALALLGETGKAQALYEHSLLDLERAYGKNNSKIVPTLIALGSFLEAEGDHSGAMALYQRAIVINEKSFSKYSPATTAVVPHPSLPLSAVGASPYLPAARPLAQRASLEVSARLEKSMPAAKDLLRKNDNSNQDLLSTFRNEIMKSATSENSRPRRSAWQLKSANLTE